MGPRCKQGNTTSDVLPPEARVARLRKNTCSEALYGVSRIRLDPQHPQIRGLRTTQNPKTPVFGPTKCGPGYPGKILTGLD